MLACIFHDGAHSIDLPVPPGPLPGPIPTGPHPHWPPPPLAPTPDPFQTPSRPLPTPSSGPPRVAAGTPGVCGGDVMTAPHANPAGPRPLKSATQGGFRTCFPEHTKRYLGARPYLCVSMACYHADILVSCGLITRILCI